MAHAKTKRGFVETLLVPRYGELGGNGNELAAAFTFQSFLSLFPLVLVGVAVIGSVSASDPDLAGRLVEASRTGRLVTAPGR